MEYFSCRINFNYYECIQIKKEQEEEQEEEEEEENITEAKEEEGKMFLLYNYLVIIYIICPV